MIFKVFFFFLWLLEYVLKIKVIKIKNSFYILKSLFVFIKIFFFEIRIIFLVNFI